MCHLRSLFPVDFLSGRSNIAVGGVLKPLLEVFHFVGVFATSLHAPGALQTSEKD